MLRNLWVTVFLLVSAVLFPQTVYDVTDYGADSSGRTDTCVAVAALLDSIDRAASVPVRIVFPKGVYRFFSDKAARKEYYISNHDQDNPKAVGIALEDFKNLTIEGNGSRFIFHGRMLPVSVVRCGNVSLGDFSIDFDDPKIAQVTLTDRENGLFEVSPEINYRIENGRFVFYGDGWQTEPNSFMVFNGETGRILPQTGDSVSPVPGLIPAEEAGPHTVRMKWAARRYPEGTVLTLRAGQRPTPGIFVHLSKNIAVSNVAVCFSEGMGLLAQMTENIHLDGFRVAPADGSARLFSAQADATHFSGCKGTVLSENGLYENMMDDAINVHGTYLRIDKRENAHTVIASYRHSQTYGFEWGFPGDSVEFIRPQTMETVGEPAVIRSIEAVDAPEGRGVKTFRITFKNPIDRRVGRSVGIENKEWTPLVVFRNNTIRNNRARGALFSTPRSVIVENNFFDHTSGTAVLLCGDCNGWFESGACTDIVIRGNRFVNALTSLYQFTKAVISICPEIPLPGLQKKYFHSGIIIENNFFDTFDRPLLYARSVDGIRFSGNEVSGNTDFRPFHPNRASFYFDFCRNVRIEENYFDKGYRFDSNSDIRRRMTPRKEIRLIEACADCAVGSRMRFPERKTDECREK